MGVFQAFGKNLTNLNFNIVGKDAENVFGQLYALRRQAVAVVIGADFLNRVYFGVGTEILRQRSYIFGVQGRIHGFLPSTGFHYSLYLIMCTKN